MQKITLSHLHDMKQRDEKITVLTVYDAIFARLMSEAGVDVLFVGDSVGMTFQGKETTLSVDLSHLVYHTKCVVQGNIGSLIMADLPFMSYHTPEVAMESAKQLMQAGAEIIKMEGGMWLCDTISQLSERGIPVCAHIGLTPQHIHLLGGYKVQGRSEKQAQELLNTALAHQEAGAQMLVVECIPLILAEEITRTLQIPVIGVGAGPKCDGQVLVCYDMLGVAPGKPLKFVKNFLQNSSGCIQDAIQAYVSAVKQGEFPTLEHSFS